jgi:hypothetical protein
VVIDLRPDLHSHPDRLDHDRPVVLHRTSFGIRDRRFHGAEAEQGVAWSPTSAGSSSAWRRHGSSAGSARAIALQSPGGSFSVNPPLKPARGSGNEDATVGDGMPPFKASGELSTIVLADWGRRLAATLARRQRIPRETARTDELHDDDRGARRRGNHRHPADQRGTTNAGLEALLVAEPRARRSVEISGPQQHRQWRYRSATPTLGRGPSQRAADCAIGTGREYYGYSASGVSPPDELAGHRANILSPCTVIGAGHTGSSGLSISASWRAQAPIRSAASRALPRLRRRLARRRRRSPEDAADELPDRAMMQMIASE